MTQQLIAIDPTALDELTAEVRALRAELSAVRVDHQPQWLTVPEYAKRMNVTTRTVRDWIAAGRVEARGAGKAREVRL